MKTYEDYADFTLRYENVEDWLLPDILEDRADHQPDDVFLQWEADGPTWTYSEVNEVVNQLAHGLSDWGVEKSDHVLLMLKNSPQYLFLWFALSKLGAVEVPVNTAYKKDSLTHVANLTEAPFGIVDEEFVPRLDEVEPQLDHLQEVGVLAEEEASIGLPGGWESVYYGDLKTSDTSNPDVHLEFQDIASIIMTSGTTGPSKAIQKTFAHQYFFAEQCVNLVQLTEDDVYMTGNPLFHSNAQVLAVFPAMVAGCKINLFEKFSASQWVDRLHQTGATVCNFLGSMMDFVYQQPERDRDDDNELRCLFAAPTAYGIVDEFKERYGVECITEVIGTTETCMPVLNPYGSDRPEGAAGLLLSEWYDVKLVDPRTDLEVETGKMGEYAIRPKHPWIITPGYYGMDDKTVEATRNCWFHTGDGLRRDEDGWFYFVDRIGDTLRRRGENISTYDVEQPLLQHEAVEECAVVGVKAEEEGGEDEVKAFVVFKQGQSATPEELTRWANDRMPYFMVPRYLEFVDELPKTENEKIQKNKLRERGNSEKTWDRVEAGVEITKE